MNQAVRLGESIIHNIIHKKKSLVNTLASSFDHMPKTRATNNYIAKRKENGKGRNRRRKKSYDLAAVAEEGACLRCAL